jgi:hypothetical protein
VTREDADGWVGKTIWQIARDGAPVAFEVIGNAGRPGFAAHEPNRFCLHLLRDDSARRSLSWDSSIPSFTSPEMAREYTLTRADHARLEKIKSAAYARRGFGVAPRLAMQPIALDLFSFAADVAALHGSTNVSRPAEAWPTMGSA